MYTSLLLAIAPAAALAAPLLQQRDAIPGKYIIKFKSNTDTVSALASVKVAVSEAPEHEYSFGDFNGFAGSLSSAEVAKLQVSDSVSMIDIT